MAEDRNTTTPKPAGEGSREQSADDVKGKFLTAKEMAEQPRDMGAANASPQRHLGRDPKNR